LTIPGFEPILHLVIETDFVPTSMLESTTLGSRSTSRTEASYSPLPKPSPLVLNLEQVAAILDVHPKTVRLMAVAGKIPAFRAGSLWRFSARRIHEWIDNPEIMAA
jgi:excisionase family DNA binding protein